MTLNAEISDFLRTHRNGELLLRNFMRSVPLDVVVHNDSEPDAVTTARNRYLREFGAQMAEALQNGPRE